MFHIEYRQGDLFSFPFDQHTLVCHVVNSLGKWGRGFVLAVDKFSERPRLAYKGWFESKQDWMLGENQYVRVPQKNVTIVNMLAQKGIGPNVYGMAPIRYESLRECLYNLREYAKTCSCVIRAPMFGSKLAGGDWKVVEQIILEVFNGSNIEFTVYQL
jgi:hypothetical protein